MARRQYQLIGGVRPIDDELILRFGGAGRKRRAGRLLGKRRGAITRGQASPRQLSFLHSIRRFHIGQFKAAQRQPQAINDDGNTPQAHARQNAARENMATYYAQKWARRGFVKLDIARAAGLAEARLTPSQAAEITRLMAAFSVSFSLVSISDGQPPISGGELRGAAAIAPTPERMTRTDEGTA